MIAIQRRIISHLNGLRCYEALIQINNFIVLTLEFDNSFIQSLLPQNTLVFMNRVYLLSQLEFLGLDTMNLINFPEQCWIDSMISKVPMK